MVSTPKNPKKKASIAPAPATAVAAKKPTKKATAPHPLPVTELIAGFDADIAREKKALKKRAPVSEAPARVPAVPLKPARAPSRMTFKLMKKTYREMTGGANKVPGSNHIMRNGTFARMFRNAVREASHKEKGKVLIHTSTALLQVRYLRYSRIVPLIFLLANNTLCFLTLIYSKGTILGEPNATLGYRYPKLTP